MENEEMNDRKETERAVEIGDSLTDEHIEQIAGGIYTRSMQCNCHAGTVTRDGQIVCPKCGRKYGQVVV